MWQMFRQPILAGISRSSFTDSHVKMTRLGVAGRMAGEAWSLEDWLWILSDSQPSFPVRCRHLPIRPGLL